MALNPPYFQKQYRYNILASLGNISFFHVLFLGNIISLFFPCFFLGNIISMFFSMFFSWQYNFQTKSAILADHGGRHCRGELSHCRNNRSKQINSTPRHRDWIFWKKETKDLMRYFTEDHNIFGRIRIIFTDLMIQLKRIWKSEDLNVYYAYNMFLNCYIDNSKPRYLII